MQFRVVVPAEGGARFALHRGLVLGSSSLRDFHRVWGRPAKFGTGRGRDYVAGYSSCFRGEEVFTKLDQSARHGRPYGAALDDEIVTSAYTFYDAQSEEKC